MNGASAPRVNKRSTHGATVGVAYGAQQVLRVGNECDALVALSGTYAQPSR
jgi:hypothetical protein